MVFLKEIAFRLVPNLQYLVLLYLVIIQSSVNCIQTSQLRFVARFSATRRVYTTSVQAKSRLQCAAFCDETTQYLGFQFDTLERTCRTLRYSETEHCEYEDGMFENVYLVPSYNHDCK